MNRLDFARKLLAETSLPVTDIAFASGFSSIRRFNDAMKTRFHRPPSGLRRSEAGKGEAPGIQLKLSYRPPLDWDALLHFFGAHGIYEQVFEFDGSVGTFRLELGDVDGDLKLQVVLSDYRHLLRVVRKVRQMFDLDSDPLLIENAFEANHLMATLCRKYPGIRVPRGWDPFETSISIILGQLVSRAQAARMMNQVAQTYGRRVINPLSGEQALLFPDAKALSRASLKGIPTSLSRKEAIREFSRQVLEGEVCLESTQDPFAFRRALLKIKGIGAWSAEMMSMRVLGDTDAFPSTDLVLKRALASPSASTSALDIATFGPWRSYAATYLWREYGKK